MRRHFAAFTLFLATSASAAFAQAAPQADGPSASSAAAGSASASGAQSPGQAKLDALLLYRQGRDLESSGNLADAQAKYVQAVTICDRELAADSKRIDAYVVKCWSLFRLGKHSDVIATGQAGLKVSLDGRIYEVMGESYYFLDQMDNSLKSLEKYLDVAGDSGDRGPTALFFMGEAYLRLKKYAHADIAYSTAVLKEPSLPRWWFRLGTACEANGDGKRALDAYNKALALSPAYPEAIAAQARVKAKVNP